jgi:cobalt-zinc-cadmium efflux system membrane fusion protein
MKHSPNRIEIMTPRSRIDPGHPMESTRRPNPTSARTPPYLCALLLLPLGLAACGGGGEGGAEQAEAATTDPQAGPQEPEEAGAHGGGEHAEEVHLTAGQRDRLGVRVAGLPAGAASGTLERPARVMFNLDRVARVGPRVPSKVVRVVRDLGDRVSEGEPITVMSSVDLGKAKAAYLTARARLETHRAEYRRERELRESDISSEAELLEAQARFREAEAELNAAREALRLYGLSRQQIEAIEAGTEEPLSYFRLSSPVEGVIQKRELAPGQSVGPQETPIHVANLDRMWVMIDAFERDVPHLSEGLEVDLTVRSLPDTSFTAETDWVSYELQEDTRTVRVRAVVDNPDGALRAGMFGTARIRPEGSVEYAMVPVDAVQTLEDRSVVFVPGQEQGSYRPVEVKTGAENEGRVEIVSGLAPGDQAVVAGAFELKSALTSGTRSAAHGH